MYAMTDTKSKDKEDEQSVRTPDARDIYDTVNENLTRVVNEVAKVQPQYSQSLSNLQLDYIQTVKNTIQNTVSAHKQLVGGVTGWNLPVASPYAEQFTRQTNEITTNLIRAVGINNQLTINALDAARDNIRIYNRTVDAIVEFNNNVTKAWTSFFSVQQQQFFKP
jgi:hypothetical protein